ncbi:MAG: ABC transporter substrate-binding protein [Cypionkella sp.]
MRHAVAALAGLILICAGSVQAFEIEGERSFGPTAPARVIEVLSTTDIDVLAPVIEEFLGRNPTLGVHYTLASSQEVYAGVVEAKQAYDVVISSAMDLQMKLANDGLAQALPEDLIAARPYWSRWRDLVVAVAQEPVTVLLAKSALEGGLPVPRTRRDLIALLRDNPARFRGRVGSYDPAVSGVGYLFAAQDARLSDTFWRLAEVMGRLDAKLYCCSGDMINAVRRGDLFMAYNVLGSYAASNGDAGQPFQVIELEDFTLTLLRTALVPKTAPNPDLATQFVAFLLSREGQAMVAGTAGLPAIEAEAFVAKPHLSPIRLDPGLLAPLDQLTRQRFLEEWRAAMDQP